MQVFSLLINEVEISIYRFLTSGAKKPKSSLNRSNLGSIGLLTVGAFNAWQVTITLDRTSAGKEQLSKERVFFAYLDQTSTGNGESVDRYPSWLSRFGQCLDLFTIFGPKTYLFLVFLLLALRQGLWVKFYANF